MKPSTQGGQALFPGAAGLPGALALVPLAAGRGVLGLLLVGFAGEHDFVAEERAYLVTLGQQCAQALERALLYQAERQAHLRSAFLAEVSRELAASLDDEQVLRRLAHRLLPLLGDACHIYLVERPGGKPVAAAGSGLYPSLLAAPATAALLGQVLSSGEPLNLPGPAAPDGRPAAAPVPGALLVLPLRARGQTLGAISFGRSAASAAYSADEAQLAEDVARRVAMAVENARLYREAQLLNTRLEDKVAERTLALRTANTELRSEVAERRRVEARLAASHEELRDFSARLERVREEEQARISREIHDELGGALTGLKIDLAQARKLLEPGQGELRQRLKRISTTIDGIVKVVRRIATDLRPGILDDFGLLAAVEWQLEEFGKRTGLTCRLDTNLGEAGWDRDASNAVFRILQEALTNVARHARASRVEVELREDGDAFILCVSDDGRGLSREAAASGKSLGLLGIHERARQLEGNVEITSPPEGGTRLAVRFPLARMRAGPAVPAPTDE